MGKAQITHDAKSYLYDRIDSIMEELRQIVLEMAKWETSHPQVEKVPCVKGHKHTDSAAGYGYNSVWACLSCGKEFPSYEALAEASE